MFNEADAHEFITNVDPLDQFDRQDDAGFQEEWECEECGDLIPMDVDECSCGYDDDDYDGQPDEYTEWQDYMGGDDWDFGQYDHYDY